MRNIPSSAWFAGLAVIVVAGVIGLAAYKGMGPSVYDDFAECLADNGVKMYGAWWCPHCVNQKKLFGSAFQFVPYVECSPNGSKTFSAPECVDAKIESTPTWIFADGTRRTGELSLDALSEKTACPLPSQP
jgi:hypothetical protein